MKEVKETLKESKYAPKQKKFCLVCGKKFQPINGRNLTCDKKCRKIWKKRYNREYFQKNKRRIRDQYREYGNEWNRKNAEKVKKLQRESYRRHRKEYMARNKERYHQPNSKAKIRKITEHRYRNLKKEAICSICGSLENLEFHHINYPNPNKFIILCHKCHLKQHNREVW